ncbi:MAG TPA: hypothetical protein PLT82_13000 [Candidatus Hydrogenedens sp.]|nr:hypothetical protein [Candidatus Hydrogenedens sp.]
MSSILDALKKLEEEKQRQLKLLEKEEIEEQDSTEIISTVSETTKPDAVSSTPDRAPVVFFSPKVFFLGGVLLLLALIVISVSVSFLVVKTQIAKNSQPVIVSNNSTSDEKSTQNEPPFEPQKAISDEATQTNDTDKNITTKAVSTPPKENNPVPEMPKPQPAQVEQKQILPPVKPSIQPEPQKEPSPDTTAKEPIESKSKQQIPIESENTQLQIARNTTEKNNRVEQEIKEEPVIRTQQVEETPVQNTVIQPPTNESATSQKPLSTPEETSSPPTPKNEPQKNIVVSSNQSPKDVTPPKVVTKELEPPPSLKPEQFQQTLSLPKPKVEESIDMTRLPVLRTSDRVRLGLENMQLNVLREAGPKNPHGLAIINLNKVYVGEIIPGSSARLLDVKTHGIAIEVVGTGERYYVPR